MTEQDNTAIDKIFSKEARVILMQTLSGQMIEYQYIFDKDSIINAKQAFLTLIANERKAALIAFSKRISDEVLGGDEKLPKGENVNGMKSIHRRKNNQLRAEMRKALKNITDEEIV